MSLTSRAPEVGPGSILQRVSATVRRKRPARWGGNVCGRKPRNADKKARKERGKREKNG